MSPLFVFFLCHLAQPPASNGYVVAIGGDVSLAREIAARAQRSGWPEVLAPLRRAWDGADARIVNLESAVGPCLPGGTVAQPRLCGPMRGLTALIGASVSAVTLANNHALDAGVRAFDDTVATLQSAGVVALGARAVRSGRIVAEPLGPIQVVTANLSRPAWPPGRGVPLPTPDGLAQVIARARRAHPHRPLLVILHGGRELGDEPSGLERGYAQAAVEAGAAAVAFHGAHVVHPLEMLGGVPVHFGLGNLLFDQRDPRAAGQVLLLRFRPGQPAEVVEVRAATR